MNLNNKIIAVIGLGYVGLPLAIEFSKLRPVIGFDTNKKRISELESSKDRNLEVTREEIEGANQLKYTSDMKHLMAAQIFIITVPTPIDISKRPDFRPLLNASEMVGKVLKKGDLVIYESTVYPGCTEELCVPILEQCSGLKFNSDFYCGYSPERINPGDKVNTLTNIKKITSGSTPEIADIVDMLYASIIKVGTHKVSKMKIAEAAKVIENVQRDLNIALVNELSVLFNRLDIDTTEVLDAASTKWNFLPFRPGMVGGHCIGVDPYYLTFKAEEVGYHPQVISAGRRINDNMARYTARSIIRLMLQNGIDVSKSNIGVMGITFKENCPDIRNSKIVDLILELESWGASVTVTDPYADIHEVMQDYNIKLHRTMDDFEMLDALVVAVGHDIYRTIKPSTFSKNLRSKLPVFADLKSIYDKHELTKLDFKVFRL